jgi:hypothetical protein
LSRVAVYPDDKEELMGRIVVTEFVSLDGVMEDPGGSEDFKYGGWSFEFNRGDEGTSSSSTRRWTRKPCCLGE